MLFYVQKQNPKINEMKGEKKIRYLRGYILSRLYKFGKEDFIKLIQVINDNDQIYNYYGQSYRNDRLLSVAKPILGEEFDFSQYEHFKYTEEAEAEEEGEDAGALGDETGVPENDPDLPF